MEAVATAILEAVVPLATGSSEEATGSSEATAAAATEEATGSSQALRDP